MEKYREGISAEDLEFHSRCIIKVKCRGFETQGSLLGMLNNISSYNLPFDYVKEAGDVCQEP